MIDRYHDLPVMMQCELLEVARPTVYYRPGNVDLMRRIDEIRLKLPLLGSRRVVDQLADQGITVSRIVTHP